MRMTPCDPYMAGFCTNGSLGRESGLALDHPRSVRRLRSLLVVALSVLAETSLGFGTWHVLLAMGRGSVVAMRNIRQVALSRSIKDAVP